jgi:2-succinyl-6-hydroxy-2,4-cyclohexadiene-1-carboxylate synthase
MAMTEKCNFIQLKIINQVGHNIHLENTLAFAENIQNFFPRSQPESGNESGVYRL